ncbi:helix-turn-helix transcriptional regulator [Nocardia cyriacigeorgica]|uniref:Helix-turn-helix transcriptional regulator n=1 Tax=Nocardia cyriacigeorgica TaxID=135487 RepID=A0A6P1D309_9NOCA|nr:helix-turn-helix transcriptional regulator [Nocardia cyriacigeorgica]NEW40084.1 helix-turn-helix transcriptional regulator [Nocardia cyriacigeorgica]NEW43343.1 helix-turn-helix transcriptional regulator [Nocardia cyriacigeorgica]NEW51590.1 helix-turn-helix transcriptional regulator [Nocardia cyriacigeorgica]
MSDEPDTYIGQRVRQIRARRGITQQVLADRAGISRSVIAKYEAGLRPVDSRRTLLALAHALGCTLGDLTGHEQDRMDPSANGFHTSVPEVEIALWSAGNVTHTAPPRGLDKLATAAQRAAELRIACDYATLGPMLAPMLTDCYRHIRDGADIDRERAWDILSMAAHTTAAALKARGYSALSWTAAQEAENAARNIGGTAALAATAFARSQVLLSRPGSLPAALEQAEGTAEQIAADVRTVGEVETYGMLHLQASLVMAAMGGDPDPHLAEAAEQADKLATAPQGKSILRNPTFGPANVALWRMSAAMERREPGQVLALAPTLSSDDLPAEGRRAQYFVEIGRAHAMQRNYRESLHALLRAEHTAPQHVRNMTHVRELVGHMMRTARRDLTTGDLGKLAQRVGVVPT